MASKRKNSENGPPSKRTGHWSQGLKASMEDPGSVVESDDKIIIIKDKYPKARHHFLVLPRENVANLKALKPSHVLLLKHMEKEGRLVAQKTDGKLKFRFGYHAIPSMSQVHMHVISQDFDSPCLKTKKHWNSFTTEYFIDSEDVIDMLENDGKIQVETDKYQEILKQDLRCHLCSEKLPNMPTLKTHILKHLPSK